MPPARHSIRPPSCSACPIRVVRSWRGWLRQGRPGAYAFPAADAAIGPASNSVSPGSRPRSCRRCAPRAAPSRCAPIWPMRCRMPSSRRCARKALQALEYTGHRTLVVAGGVGANRELRARLTREAAGDRGAGVSIPRVRVLHRQCRDDRGRRAASAARRRARGRRSKCVRAGRCRSCVRPAAVRWALPATSPRLARMSAQECADGTDSDRTRGQRHAMIAYSCAA